MLGDSCGYMDGDSLKSAYSIGTIMPTLRGYQGKRYRVYDHETESFRDYSADEFQCMLWLYEKSVIERDQKDNQNNQTRVNKWLSHP